MTIESNDYFAGHMKHAAYELARIRQAASQPNTFQSTFDEEAVTQPNGRRTQAQLAKGQATRAKG